MCLMTHPLANLWFKGYFLLPLYGRTWLWRHVVANTVYGWNFFKNTLGNLVEDGPVDVFDGCGHGVDGVHRTDNNRPVV